MKKVIAKLNIRVFSKKSRRRAGVGMGEVFDVRQMFDSKLRNTLYVFLINGPLQGEPPELVIKFTDQVLYLKKDEINRYLAARDVNLLNMNDHVSQILSTILVPFLREKRVR